MEVTAGETSMGAGNLIQDHTWSHHAGFVSLVPKEKNRLDSTLVVV